MKEEDNRRFEELKVGDKAAIEETITEHDVNLFAKVSGDNNPVHVDDNYAKQTRFKKRIAHGMLAASLLSRVVGTKLPGPGTIYLSQTLSFKAPVYFGDTVRAEVEITEKLENKNFVKLRTVCSNQTGSIVLEGEALVLYGK